MASSLFREFLRQLSERGITMLGRPRGASSGNLVSLSEQLLSGRGEASSAALAQLVLDIYAGASPEARLAFLTALAKHFGADERGVGTAIEAWCAKPDALALNALHRATEPRRQELIRRLNMAHGGTAALVRMREDILAYLGSNPELRPVDVDFADLFSSWFNRGFLLLQSIDWTTPAHILEKIIRYEAVHAISDWDDLRGRLEPQDRRCFAFFHPQLIDEPLIFVEVALTSEIPAAIAPLLAQDRTPIRAREATTAVFYSISNTQKGLAGVSFGNFLIKQVVNLLKEELPSLKNFVTLSPVPGYARWLDAERAQERSDALDDETKEALRLLDEQGWYADEEKTERLRRPLLSAAAWYFLKARSGKGRPLDPVARFHLGNGARLERLNFLGDVSAKGLAQSHGLMVNYLYPLDDIEKNHEAFASAGAVIASPAVKRRLKGEASPRVPVGMLE
ncbi:malonyl-CoA decarboxylase [Chelativorans alearense]|uniref:malonyl-CoA decarboxylase n=1 Tax=Chelativorans alearense TaxID=2681495 RepID=UPI0013CFDBB4|nr:malonyl-CoA decarboxylase [Chelativorans alearense]